MNDFNDEEFKEFERLQLFYDSAKQICDPLDFAIRQRDLVHVLAEFILMPFWIEKQKIKQDENKEKSKIKNENMSLKLAEKKLEKRDRRFGRKLVSILKKNYMKGNDNGMDL